MSKNVRFLHSHSLLENKLDYPKNIVLIDKKYASMFPVGVCWSEPMRYEGVDYLKVEILDFVAKKGTFKALDR